MAPAITTNDRSATQPCVVASALRKRTGGAGLDRKMVDSVLEAAHFVEQTERTPEFITSLLQIVSRGLNADMVVLYELDETDSRLAPVFHYARSGNDSARLGEISRDEGLPGKALAARQACMDSKGPLTQMAVPLISADELTGVMIVSADPARQFQRDDLDLLTIFGVQVACCMRDDQMRRNLQTLEASLRDQFLRAEKMRAIGEMASGVFHDFNNILGAVIGRMQLLQAKVQEESILNTLSQIERIALQGAQTVNRLQEFARLQETKETGPVDLNRVVADALELTRHRWETQAQKRGINYTIKQNLSDDVTVQGVHAQLVDAIVNLVRNAIDAMADGGELVVETKVNGSICRLSISDNGPGMSPEQIDQVFKPFFTTKGAEGTGLGMTVVNDIIQSLNGTIHLDSKLGEGTTIAIELPVFGETSVAAAVPVAEEEDDGLRLLVVDDDDIILEVVSEALDDAGHHVDSFKQGADAIDAIGRNTYDVIITDLGMPGVTGWDVARTAKMHEPQLPVVVISGWGAQFTDDQLTDSGVDAMLAKPFHLKMLRETIERLARGETTPTKIITK